MRKLRNVMVFAMIAVLALSFAGCDSKKEAVVINGVADLKGKTIGVQKGTTGDTYSTDEYEKKGQGTVDRYSKGADAIVALKQGKVDCVIIDSEPAKAFVESNKDLKILEEPFADEDYAICISKENGELKTKINEAIATLKENGTLDQIVKNYIGDDTKGTCPYVKDESVTRSNGTLTMATNAFFPPYEYYEGEKIVGIDAEMAQAVADQLGMELVIEDMAFDSIIVAVQSGKADIGVAGMTVTEDRLKSIDFTDTYAKGKQVIIVKK